jgi:hypothetical protein
VSPKLRKPPLPHPAPRIDDVNTESGLLTWIEFTPKGET